MVNISDFLDFYGEILWVVVSKFKLKMVSKFWILFGE